ncbi:hypothetical protein ACQ4LE_009145 [Meloidogyne hapla]
MPIIFKQHQRLKTQRHKPVRSLRGKTGRRLLHAAPTAIRRLSVRLTDGRQFRAGMHGIRALRRHSIRAGRSIYRIKETGTSLHKYLRDPKLFLQLAKYIYNRRHLKHLIPLIFVFIYMITGSIFFYYFESNAERARILAKNDEYEKERSFFVKRMEELVVDLVARDPNKRQEFMEEAIDHLSWRLSYELASKKSEWSILTSMYFSGTIFTTIGYGDVACITSMGRFATVLYALFGIPLMLTTWNEMGKFLYKSINEFIVVLGNNWIKFRHSLNILFFKIRQKISGLCCLSIIKKGNRSNSQGSVIKEEDDKSDENNLNEKHNFKFNAIFLDNINNSASRQLEQGKVVSFKLSMQMLQAADNINLRNNERNSKIEPENNSEQNSSETDFSSVQQLNVENLMVKNENEKQEESINYDDSNENSDTSDLTEDDLEQTQPDAPRMHVLVAIACTFSWIFLCAGLFQLWEEWSYWDSLYFTFISLLTIGLGDVNVQRRDLMMLCFIFVMIGLSLVSMCIMVIQISLEDFYKNMIVKLVTDYQTKMERGRNQRRSSMGSIIKSNRKEKYLMPMTKCIFQMVPQSTKRHVMEEVEEEARESGIILPPALKNHNTVDQLIFDNKNDFSGIYEDTTVIVVNGILKQESSFKEQQKDIESKILNLSNSRKQLESSTQTLLPLASESCIQMSAFTEVRSVQTTLMRGDLRDLKHKDNNVTMNDAAIQTDRLRLSFKKLQIRSRRNDAQTMTFTSLGQNIMNAKSQTDKKLLTEDQGIQTWIPFELVDLYEKDTQTYRFMKSQRIQTPKPVNNDAQTQSHNTDLNGQIYPSVSVLKMFLNPIDIDHNNDIV